MFYYQTNSSVVRHSGFGFDSKDLLPKMSDVARDRVTVCQKPTHSFVLYGKWQRFMKNESPALKKICHAVLSEHA